MTFWSKRYGLVEHMLRAGRGTRQSGSSGGKRKEKKKRRRAGVTCLPGFLSRGYPLCQRRLGVFQTTQDHPRLFSHPVPNANVSMYFLPIYYYDGISEDLSVLRRLVSVLALSDRSLKHLPFFGEKLGPYAINISKK